MAFQQAVFGQMAAGIPGELAYDGPKRVFPYTLVSSPNLNIVGSTFYTLVSEGVATAGGAGPIAGLLVDPKAYALLGSPVLNGALAPSMTLPDETIGEIAAMGIFFAVLTTAANPGDNLSYATATGLLASYAAGGSLPGGQTAIPGGKVILRVSGANALAIIELNG